MTIYERFVICFNTLNGPLSRITAQYILANIRPVVYYNGKVIIVLYCVYPKARCMCLSKLVERAVKIRKCFACGAFIGI